MTAHFPGWVKLVLWTKTSSLSEIMWTCKCLRHVSKRQPSHITRRTRFPIVYNTILLIYNNTMHLIFSDNKKKLLSVNVQFYCLPWCMVVENSQWLRLAMVSYYYKNKIVGHRSDLQFFMINCNIIQFNSFKALRSTHNYLSTFWLVAGKTADHLIFCHFVPFKLVETTCWNI